MKRKITDKSGITLIALVITIIVLLILSGIAISMLSGENGILKRAVDSKIYIEKQSKIQNIQLAILSSMIAPNNEIDKNILEKELKKEYKEVEIIDAECYIVKIDGILYKINKDGILEEGEYNIKTEVSTTGEIALKNVSKKGIIDYKIYGNSVQDGTPSVVNPVEVQSVGDLVTEGKYKDKYKISLKVNGEVVDIYLDEPLRGITSYGYFSDTKSDKYKYDLDYIDFKNKKIVRNIKEYVIEDISQIKEQGNIAYNYLNEDLYVRTVLGGKGMSKLHPGGTIFINDMLSNYMERCERKGQNKYLVTSHYLTSVNSYDYIYFYWNLQKLGFTVEESTETDGFLGTPTYTEKKYYNVYDGETKLTDFAQIRAKIGELFTEPVTIYYPLATPIEEKIELPSILNDIEDCTITVDTQIKPNNIEVTYLESK